ncbi:MAG TPA: LytR C-terminal domain-containing protein [Gaiellaceae bacterium]|nr:LytR C-terminal domain-containing protein [Gaiellaceae bacterium]
MDAPLTPAEIVRPWRTATLVASAVAALELVLLLVAGFVLLAKPLARAVRGHTSAQAAAPATPIHVRVGHPRPAVARRTRARTRVVVLNGNGRAGAAAAAAASLRRLGYPAPRTGNATRTDYATTVVMYRPGYQGEAARLGRDLHVHVVAPLDGIKPAALHGAQLLVLLGAA